MTATSGGTAPPGDYDNNSKKAPQYKFSFNKLILGGVAGTTAKSCVAPLERVRIVAQTHGGLDSSFVITAKIVKEQGLKGEERSLFPSAIEVSLYLQHMHHSY
jgi:hypothetical protein